MWAKEGYGQKLITQNNKFLTRKFKNIKKDIDSTHGLTFINHVN